MEHSGLWLFGVITLVVVVSVAWVFLFVWLSRKAVPKKSTPKTVLIGAVGQAMAILNMSFFMLCGVPYRNDIPTIFKLLYFIALHVLLFWISFNCQHRVYFLKVSPGHNKLGWQRNLVIFVLFAALSTIMFLIHPLPWFESSDAFFKWYPLFVQLYFVLCNCLMVWFIWVVLRAQKFDVWCKKTVIGHVEKQGDCWIEMLNPDGDVPKITIVNNLCDEKKVPLD